LVIGSFAEAKCKQVEKTPQAERRALARDSESPDAHYPCGRPHRIRPKGATGTRRSARPLTRGAGMRQTTAPPRR